MANDDFINELDDREIDMLLKYVSEYTEQNFQNIQDKFFRKANPTRKNFSHKKLAFLAAATLVLLFSTLVYANVLDISKIYRMVFGEDSKYVEPYIKPFVSAGEAPPTQENQVANEVAPISGNQGTNNNQGSYDNATPSVIQSEYDGIVIKLISAINDENGLQIFATMTDTIDDRLSNSIDFVSWGLSQGDGGGISVIDYDQATKTATLMITSLGSVHQVSATLTINDLTIGRELLRGLSESGLDVVKLLKDHTPDIIPQNDVWKTGGGGGSVTGSGLYYENTNLLKPDETDVMLQNAEGFSISNVGFVDGMLHIQVKTESVPDEIDYPYISINFVDPTGAIVYTCDTIIDFIDRNYAHEDTRKLPHSEYIEMIYDDVTSPEQLNNLSVTIDHLKSPNVIKGHWEFSFTIPEKVTTEFPVGREIDINGEKLMIDTVSLSPLGITIHLPKDMSADYKHNDSTYVKYEDGTIVDLNQSSIQTNKGKSTLNFGGHVIEIEKVISIIINGESIDVTQ